MDRCFNSGLGPLMDRCFNLPVDNGLPKIGGLEVSWEVATGQLQSLSEVQLLDCSKQNNGFNGGLMDYAFLLITILQQVTVSRRILGKFRWTTRVSLNYRIM